MKNVSIYVEGDADKRFIEDYISFLASQNTSIVLPDDWKSRIQKTGGWTTIDSDKGEFARVNMHKTTNRGGVNLVIFDADNDIDTRRKEIEKIRNKYGLLFELFLLPNNTNTGALEELLEQVINPENLCILECWRHYEDELKQQYIPWKNPHEPTTPSSKSKIYAYLEALVGTSHKEKDKIKDKERDFLNSNHWNLTANGLIQLRDFLLKYI